MLLVAGVLTGCRTLGFYAQAAKGQFQLLTAREAISELMKDANTPPDLKQRFEALAGIRTFAVEELGLSVDGHYKSYADVHRPYVVWNVEAARAFSMTPKKWWYPVVGKQQYRGYFAYKNATNYAAALARNGYDTYVGGVQAYSTLGWFKDPALNTFIFDPDPYLAELIFHELSHQRVFARGDTDFNEAFATTVGEEGARRWLRRHRSPEMLADYEQTVRRHYDFVNLVLRTRGELEALYGDTRNEEGELQPNKLKDRKEDEMAREKDRVFARLRTDYSALKEGWDSDSTYDTWFAAGLNNAKLNSIAAYYDLVPGFRALLASEKGDLKNFYSAVEKLAGKPEKERRQRLEALVLEGTRSAGLAGSQTGGTDAQATGDR